MLNKLTPHRFECKCDANNIIQYFLSVARFEPGSLGWTVLFSGEHFARLPRLVKTSFKDWAQQDWQDWLWPVSRTGYCFKKLGKCRSNVCQKG
jgi:hypothetical protein